MNLSMKHRQTHRHRVLWLPGEVKLQERHGLGVGDQQMQTIVYRTDKQQQPTA